MRNIDFAVEMEPQFGFKYEVIEEVAQVGESLGYDAIWLSDHFSMYEDSVNINCLECWTTLSALAGVTKSIKLGPMVLGQSYRNPALLAKMAATLDNISNGRLWFGLGAGWKDFEYKAYGYPFPKPGIRIGQLEDAIKIAKKMWTEDNPTYIGKYYSIENPMCFPKPIQKPYPPIVIGGSGELTLKVAAKHANAINSCQVPEVFKQKLEVLKKHCKKIGRDYDSIRKTTCLTLTLAETEQKVQRKLEEEAKRSQTHLVKYLNKPSRMRVNGTPDVVANRLREYVDAGADYFMLGFYLGDEETIFDIESMELFMDEVKKLI